MGQAEISNMSCHTLLRFSLAKQLSQVWYKKRNGIFEKINGKIKQ